MKKLFFSLMAMAAICAGFVSCDADDVIGSAIEKFVKPQFADKAGVYEDGDNTLELTESGNYIATIGQDSNAPATRGGSDVKVYTGTYTINMDGLIELSGELTGTVDVEKGKAEIKTPEGVSVDLKQKQNTKKYEDLGEDEKVLCRTWNIDEKAVVDGKKVTISDVAYEKYFGSYGYPKQVIISAAGAFCVKCDKKTFAGKWKLGAKGGLLVEGTPFKEEIPYVIGEQVTIDFTVTEEAASSTKAATHTVKAHLTEVK